ncbi:Flp family type IVb pilin [Arthrobacter sp. CAU 1506]|uniref:Flp family type IVb pilin n=1 Tax=Arthrobacter sp. CAU 1506 TaxID=2560052 RepID=UPI00197ACF41|nr:Flp family type IVb pilin [Arthrobacter sp. CAU 1506]
MLAIYATMQTMFHTITDRLNREEKGATAVEYGVMVALIVAVIVGVVFTIGQDLLAAFTTVEQQLP